VAPLIVLLMLSTPVHAPDVHTTSSPVVVFRCSSPSGVQAPDGVVVLTSTPGPWSPFGPLSEPAMGDHVPPLFWETVPVVVSR
jgi:hypothetical protein